MNLFEAHAILKIQTDGSDVQVDRKEIEKAYRKQALKLHPDRGGDAALFRQLQAAKEVALQQFGSSLTWSSYIMNNSAVGETLHNERTCVRQVFTDPNHPHRIGVATDDGMWLLQKNQSYTEWICRSFETGKSFFSCCIVGEIMYAGGKCGQLFWLNCRNYNHGFVVATPFQEANILSIAASSHGWITICTSNKGIAVLLNLSDSAGPPNLMLAWRTALESTNPESVILEVSDDEEYLFLWVGGSKSGSNKGELILWKLETSELYGELVDLDSVWLDGDDEEASNSEGSSPSSKDPLIVQSIDEGPVYSIAKCNDTIAAIVGQAVLVWEFWSKDACLIPLKTLTLPGDYEETLYTVSLSSEFLVAAGLGECLFVWATDTWELIHTVSVTRQRESCLATCCVLTTDWLPNVKGVIACGGYDGCVSLWRFAHRLESDG